MTERGGFRAISFKHVLLASPGPPRLPCPPRVPCPPGLPFQVPGLHSYCCALLLRGLSALLLCYTPLVFRPFSVGTFGSVLRLPHTCLGHRCSLASSSFAAEYSSPSFCPFCPLLVLPSRATVTVVSDFLNHIGNSWLDTLGRRVTALGPRRPGARAGRSLPSVVAHFLFRGVFQISCVPCRSNCGSEAVLTCCPLSLCTPQLQSDVHSCPRFCSGAVLG